VQLAAGFLPATSVSVGVGTACPANPSDTDVATVSATSVFTFVTPIGALAGFAAGPISLTGKAVMRCLG
jgi:hypothetical protein